MYVLNTVNSPIWHIWGVGCSNFMNLLVIWEKLNRNSGRAIAQAVSCRLPTSVAQVQTRVWSCGILWWTKVALGQVFSPRSSVSPANLHSICFSTIIFTITWGWHNRPGVAAVPIASQTKLKKTVSLGHATAQAVSHRLPTAVAQVQTRVWSCGILWWTKVALGQVFFPRTSVSPANVHSICFSTIIFTITRGWHNRPGVAAVPIAS
jgi:hypothetical protein